jgi:hypothetical protein
LLYVCPFIHSWEEKRERERKERENKMAQILIQNDPIQTAANHQISTTNPFKRSKLATVPELDHKWKNRCRQSSITKCAAATELVAIHQGKRKWRRLKNSVSGGGVGSEVKAPNHSFGKGSK